MLFNSLDFALYLPIVFFIYWFVFGNYSIAEYASRRIHFLKPVAQFFSSWHNSLKLQNLFIVVASYVFYGWWDWRFLLLIFFTSICSWGSGLLIDRKRQDSFRIGKRSFEVAKTISGLNIVLNLGILGFFKYFNFFVDSFADTVTFFGGHPDVWTLKIVLPVGISFYTFQALSYSIDVYREKLKPTKDIVAFLAFVSFFPQLVAGPIERATNLLPQFYKKRQFSYDNAVDGIRQMLWGFFKKMVIADNCAVYVNNVWTDYAHQSGSTLAIAAIFFSFQIYGDFSGYSDIAIGTGKLFGIKLMKNFDVPYFSRNIGEFWRRWHISLTTWFKDYLYFPLGGSRVGKWKTIRNTFIIFLVSGFWHGANWTFILWGGFHAMLFLPALITGGNRKYAHKSIAEGRLLPPLSELCSILWTFLLATIGWIIFRAPTIADAFHYMVGIFSVDLFTVPHLGLKKMVPLITYLLVIEWVNRNSTSIFRKRGNFILDVGLIVFTVVLLYFYRQGESPFIYFQF